MSCPKHLTSTPVALLIVALLATGCDRLQTTSATAPAPAPVAAPAAPAAPAPEPVPAVAAAPAPVPAAAPVAAKGEPSLEVQSHIKQAFSYVSNAKNAREVSIRDENIENAVKEFSLAIQKDARLAGHL